MSAAGWEVGLRARGAGGRAQATSPLVLFVAVIAVLVLLSGLGSPSAARYAPGRRGRRCPDSMRSTPAGS